MTLVSTIISMAHSLRLKVVAEGVDAEEQAEALDRSDAISCRDTSSANRYP